MTMRDRITGNNTPFTLDDHNSRKRVIYEVWNKADGKVYWLSTGYDELCDCRDDPLKLRNFFPVPEPLSATMTNESLIPIPDFSEYQDQANQIDELTQRISLLAKALKVAGCYDAANKPLRRLLDESVENELIPVEGWATFSQKGGLTSAIAFLPIKEVIDTMEGLITVRAKVIEDFERVTGLQALVSQTNDARETLGGQRIKNNGAQTRIEDKRQEVSRFAQDVVRLVAEIIAKHFQPATLVQISGILYEEGIDPESMQPVDDGAPQIAPPAQPMAQPGGQLPLPLPAPGAAPAQPGLPAPIPPPTAQSPQGLLPPQVMKILTRIKKAIDLLKKDIPRGYRIDIETDTMIAGDVQQERQDATEFVKAMTEYMTAATQIGAQNPLAVPLLAKMMQWAVRKFRTGRDLESAIDEFADKSEKAAQANAANMGGHQSPDQIKAQADATKAQAEIAKAKLDQQSQAQNDQREQQLAAQRHQFEMEKLAAEQQMARERHSFEMQKLAAERMAHASETGLPAPTMATATAQGHQDNVTKLHDAAAMIHRAANTKKRIVRGPDGKAIGIEPVPEGQ
jgi:hypothetical protein